MKRKLLLLLLISGMMNAADGKEEDNEFGLSSGTEYDHYRNLILASNVLRMPNMSRYVFAIKNLKTREITFKGIIYPDNTVENSLIYRPLDDMVDFLVRRIDAHELKLARDAPDDTPGSTNLQGIHYDDETNSIVATHQLFTDVYARHVRGEMDLDKRKLKIGAKIYFNDKMEPIDCQPPQRIVDMMEKNIDEYVVKMNDCMASNRK